MVNEKTIANQKQVSAASRVVSAAASRRADFSSSGSAAVASEKANMNKIENGQYVGKHALSVNVFRSSLGDCTNGGATSKSNSILVVCESGPYVIAESDIERTFTVEVKHVGKPYPYLKPVQHKGGIGPMHGGNLAGTSDSRFCAMVEKVCGASVSALPVHDRFESQELYDTLSR